MLANNNVGTRCILININRSERLIIRRDSKMLNVNPLRISKYDKINPNKK